MTAKIAHIAGAAALLAACAASTAAAQGVGGDVPNKCSIGTASAGTKKGAAAVIPSDHGATLDFSGAGSNSFGDGMGHGLEVSGTALLALDTNTNCTVTLSSLNGALWNRKAGAVRSYTADAFDMSNPSAKTVLNLNSRPAPPAGTFQTTSASTYVLIEFNVPDTGSQVLPAGTYTDTLTLTMSPS